MHGVIYAIIHIPSSKIYIGQTIRSASNRFEGHWGGRHKGDFRNSLLHRLMEKQLRSDFIIWPLEQIHPRHYTYTNENGNKEEDKTRFRRYAHYREQHWIQLLYTMHPRGLNMCKPVRKFPCRHPHRPKRWENRNAPAPATQTRPPPNCFIVDNNILNIRTQPGPHSKTRSTLQHWILIARNNNKDQLEQAIDSVPHREQLVAKRFLLLHCNAQLRQQHVSLQLVEQTLCEKTTEDRRNAINKKEKEPFKNFIKLIYSNKILNILDLPSILHSQEVLQHYPFDRNNPPKICCKQLSPLSIQLCNFSYSAHHIPEDIANWNPTTQPCKCRAMFPHCTTLQEGHVCSTDASLITNEYTRNLFS